VTELAAHHTIPLKTFHYKWNREHKPVLRIQDGDSVTFEINDVWSWEIKKTTKASDLPRLDPEKLYPLAGPVYVDGAKPGDALVVEVLDVTVDDFGWTAILPGFGILEEFQKPYLYKWDLKDKRLATFENGIRIPLNPFCGVLGVAPDEKGSFNVAPPGKHGGNMDIRHLTKGSTVKIPVWVPGALFSAGDVHAAMGDAEVCICAIECAGTAKLRFTLEKNAQLRAPQYVTRGDKQAERGYYGTTGIAPDLWKAMQESVRNMLSYLTKKYDLTMEEAYVLCSVAADVRVHEAVDKPNWVVGTVISQDIFSE
jgi:acetamidase/formamidase